jgi:hypothetical protein
MDIVGILVILFLGAGIGRFLSSGGTARGLDAFAAGFLPYREDGWPRGVQEGEPITFKLSAMSDRGVPPAEREPAPDAGVEVIEIDGADAAELTGIDHRRISGGTSIRPVRLL